jgi:SAM-dependent methyltransferase
MYNVNNVACLEDKSVFVGWCLPHDGLLDNTEIVINGVPFEPTRDGAEGVYAERYPWHPNAAYAAFRVEVPHSVLDIRAQGEVSIFCRSKLYPSKASGYTLDFLVKDLAFEVPPPEVAARIGVSDRMQYVMYGRGIYRGFERALQKNFGTSFASYSKILDWGCGSARIARHILPTLSPAASLIGFDIDEYAVDWSNKNVGRSFHVCKTEPPLDLAAASADVAYAYSVFTHLAADNMSAWADEMARVLKPGGIGLFTVLSENAMIALMPGIARHFLEDWQKTGIYDSVQNSQLETIGVSGDYYRNVWFKRHYLEKVFGRHFDIVDYIGTFHFYQDLIVLRRR